MSITDKIGKKGQISSGQYAGFFVRIDSQNTRSCLILIWKDSPPEGYDYWVEKATDLEQFFQEAGWDIEWLE